MTIKKHGTMKIFPLFAAIIAMLMPGLAAAQSSLGDLPDGADKMVGLIAGLFGSLVSYAGVTGLANPMDPLRDMVTMFASVVMIASGIVMGYIFLAGMLNSANDGEVFGRKWSSPWLVARTVIGVGVIAPVLSGYALIQVLVVWGFLQGLTGANMMIDAVFSKNTLMSYATPSVHIKDKILDLETNTLAGLVCLSTINYENSKLDNTLGTPSNVNGVSSVSPVKGVYYWGNSDNKQACGGFVMPKSSPTTEYNTAEIKKAHEIGMSNMINELWPVAQAIVERQDRTDVSYEQIGNEFDLAGIANRYESAIRDVTVTLATKDNAYADRMKNYIQAEGFLGLGSWFVEWTNFQNRVQATVGDIPQVIPVNMNIFNKYSYQEQIKTNIDGVKTVMKKRSEQLSNANPNSLAQYSDVLLDERASESILPVNAMGWISNSLLGVYVRTADETALNKPEGLAKNNLIMEARSKGDTIITATTSMMVAAIALKAALGGDDKASNFSPNPIQWAMNLSGASSTISLFVNLFIGLLLPLLLFGLLLFYYIPFVPYLIWITGVAGLIVLLIEAVISSLIWAFAHLYPDGDGIVGRAGQGYSLVLSLVLRPALMVLGFGFAIALMNVFGYIFHATFDGAFKINNGGSTGFFGLFVAISLYTYLMINLTNKCSSIIHVVPDQILKWAGGHVEQLGNFSRETTGNLESVAAGFAGGVMSGVGRTSGAANAAANTRANIHANNMSAAQSLGSEMAEKLGSGNVSLGDTPFASGALKTEAGQALEVSKDVGRSMAKSMANQVGGASGSNFAKLPENAKMAAVAAGFKAAQGEKSTAGLGPMSARPAKLDMMAAQAYTQASPHGNMGAMQSYTASDGNSYDFAGKSFKDMDPQTKLAAQEALANTTFQGTQDHEDASHRAMNESLATASQETREALGIGYGEKPDMSPAALVNAVRESSNANAAIVGGAAATSAASIVSNSGGAANNPYVGRGPDGGGPGGSGGRPSSGGPGSGGPGAGSGGSPVGGGSSPRGSGPSGSGGGSSASMAGAGGSGSTRTGGTSAPSGSSAGTSGMAGAAAAGMAATAARAVSSGGGSSSGGSSGITSRTAPSITGASQARAASTQSTLSSAASSIASSPSVPESARAPLASLAAVGASVAGSVAQNSNNGSVGIAPVAQAFMSSLGDSVSVSKDAGYSQALDGRTMSEIKENPALSSAFIGETADMFSRAAVSENLLKGDSADVGSAISNKAMTIAAQIDSSTASALESAKMSPPVSSPAHLNVKAEQFSQFAAPVSEPASATREASVSDSAKTIINQNRSREE